MTRPAAFATLLALAACSRAPRGDDRARPLEHRAGTIPADAASAPPPDAPSDCVAACVRARQMEAVSIDYIRASCARTCVQPIPPTLP